MKKYKWEVPNHLNNRKNKKLRDIEILDVLLENRGLITKKQKRDFINPISPLKLTLKNFGIDSLQMSLAVERIIKAIETNETIIIYGDYDADGVCSSAILWETLFQYTNKVLPYIPDRFSEGYGINETSLETVIKNNPQVSLIITVDNGISAVKTIKQAQAKGIDVIIADHHEKLDKLPSAHSIIHTKSICGAGIAWVLARELTKKIKIELTKLPSDESTVNDLLELVAIGTIADQMPFLGTNRSLVKYGLEKLNKTKRIGLLELINIAGIKLGALGNYEVGFLIAPRINASGRLKHAIDSLRLICTKSRKKAREFALHLNEINRERQEIVDKTIILAQEKMKEDTSQKIIILDDKKFHEGVIGLAASKLVDKYYLPVILISVTGKIGKGSARSIEGVNIIKLIKKADSLLIGGGGHTMAAGFSIKLKDIKKFKKIIENKAYEIIPPSLLQKKLKVEVEINADFINHGFVEKLWQLEPYGLGNPNPIFITRNCYVQKISCVGQNMKHLKLTLIIEDKIFSAIGFGIAEKGNLVKTGDRIDIAYNIAQNEWNGEKRIDLIIKDFKKI